MSLLFSTRLLKYDFFAFLTRFKKKCFSYSMNILSLVDPSQTWPEWYSYLTRVTVWLLYLFITDWHMSADFIHKQLAPHCYSLVRVMCWYTLSNDIQMRSTDLCMSWERERERERERVCVCVCVCVFQNICLISFLVASLSKSLATTKLVLYFMIITNSDTLHKLSL